MSESRADPPHPAPMQEGALGWPGRKQRWLSTLLVVGVVMLQLRAMLGPHEDWPFTSAPMFARYQAPGDPLAEFRVHVTTRAGESFELRARRDLGLGELGFRRQFFSHYYGSTDPVHPAQHHPRDTFARHRERLGLWFGKVARAYRRQRGELPHRLRLDVVRTSSGAVEARTLFEYVPATAELITQPHPWERPSR